MLERSMGDETKADMAARINKMESQDKTTNEPVGLTYSQHGKEYHSAHFDLSALKTALSESVQAYANWELTRNWTAMEAAWMKVGLAQRDVPVHVINEYCRKDRSFEPCPEFKEDKLPREIMFYYWNSDKEEPLFPLVISASSGLGINFSLSRGGWARRAGGWLAHAHAVCAEDCVAAVDLAAVNRLDEVRTTDLTRSREILGLIEPEHVHGSRPF